LQPSPARSAEFVPKPDFVPKADTYICPNVTGGAVECYLDAVPHLYTMCRQVKSIEIIEHGYEKSAEGTNGAKSEYCIDKHRLSMARPYQAALKEATPNAAAVDALRALQELWLKSLSELKWNPGETDEQYKARVAKPYEVFSERVTAVRAVLAASKDKAPPPSADKARRQTRHAAAQDQERQLSDAALSTASAGARASDRELTAILGESGLLAGALPAFAFARNNSRWRTPSPTRSSVESPSSPKPAPAPARRSRTSCPPFCTAAR
jgi:hypothetical protein